VKEVVDRHAGILDIGERNGHAAPAFACCCRGRWMPTSGAVIVPLRDHQVRR